MPLALVPRHDKFSRRATTCAANVLAQLRGLTIVKQQRVKQAHTCHVAHCQRQQTVDDVRAEPLGRLAHQSAQSFQRDQRSIGHIQHNLTQPQHIEQLDVTTPRRSEHAHIIDADVFVKKSTDGGHCIDNTARILGAP
jgi:hypothetical protein